MGSGAGRLVNPECTKYCTDVESVGGQEKVYCPHCVSSEE